MLKPINLRSVVVVIVFTLGFISHATGQVTLSAEIEQSPAAGAAPDHPANEVHKPSIKLSWGASTPATKLSRDAVVGYNVYRSTTSHDRNPKCINSKPWPGTVYVDSDVAPGITYYYVARGLTAKQVESRSSNEAHAMIPPR